MLQGFQSVAALERSDNVVSLGPRFRLWLKRGYRSFETALTDWVDWTLARECGGRGCATSERAAWCLNILGRDRSRHHLLAVQRFEATGVARRHEAPSAVIH